MYIRKLSQTLVLVAALIATVYADAAEKKKDPAFRAKLDTIVSSHYTDIVNSPALKMKLKSLDEMKALLKSERKANLRQTEQDEIYFDTFTAALDQLPKKNKFKIKDCDKYRNSILVQFEPMVEKEPKNPAVIEALRFLSEICK